MQIVEFFVKDFAILRLIDFPLEIFLASLSTVNFTSLLAEVSLNWLYLAIRLERPTEKKWIIVIIMIMIVTKISSDIVQFRPHDVNITAKMERDRCDVSVSGAYISPLYNLFVRKKRRSNEN